MFLDKFLPVYLDTGPSVCLRLRRILGRLGRPWAAVCMSFSISMLRHGFICFGISSLIRSAAGESSPPVTHRTSSVLGAACASWHGSLARALFLECGRGGGVLRLAGGSVRPPICNHARDFLRRGSMTGGGFASPVTHTARNLAEQRRGGGAWLLNTIGPEWRLCVQAKEVKNYGLSVCRYRHQRPGRA